jgi:hypothetical protein
MSSTFAFAGSYVDVHDIGLSSTEQSLRLNLLNLGDQSIFWARCWVNGTLLPYTFGVSRDSLINPSGGLSERVYTSWIDPTTGTRRGVILKADESYPVHLELRYLDGSSRVYDTIQQAESVSGMALIVRTYGIEGLETDLVDAGNGNSLLSVSFRSTWIKPITGMEILLDEKLVVAAPCSLRLGSYWVGGMGVPFKVYTGEERNMTLRLTAEDGEPFSTAQVVECQLLNWPL